MSLPIQDIPITNIPIIGITATVIPRIQDLVTVTGIMDVIGAVILLIGGIINMAVIEEGTETAGTVGLVVFAEASMADSIDKNATIFR